MDAADPDTPAFFLGDTPGSLGYNDHADPMVRRMVPTPHRSPIPVDPPDRPASRNQCDGDWRYGATARMMLGGVWVAMDKQAWEIFDLWFNGKADDVTFENDDWADYMRADAGLTTQIHAHLLAHAESMRARINRSEGPIKESFHLTFHAELGGTYGGYRTGYEV